MQYVEARSCVSCSFGDKETGIFKRGSSVCQLLTNCSQLSVFAVDKAIKSKVLTPF